MARRGSFKVHAVDNDPQMTEVVAGRPGSVTLGDHGNTWCHPGYVDDVDGTIAHMSSNKIALNHNSIFLYSHTRVYYIDYTVH